MLAIVSTSNVESWADIFLIADDTMQMSPLSSRTRAVIFCALLSTSTL